MPCIFNPGAVVQETPYSCVLADYAETRRPDLKEKKYWGLFCSLNELLKPPPASKFKRLRELTEKTMKYFLVPFPLTSENIAWYLTKVTDESLLAINNPYRPSKFSVALELGHRSQRERDDRLAKQYITNEISPDNVSCRIPSPLAVAQGHLSNDVPKPWGHCEEHMQLTLYLLTVAHMIQDLPFGQLNQDIFYACLAQSNPNHAYVILVQGLEFMEAISKAKAAKKQNPQLTILSWLSAHPEEWGESAWVIDGWRGRHESVRRACSTTRCLPSDFPEPNCYSYSNIDSLLSDSLCRSRMLLTDANYLSTAIAETGIEKHNLREFTPNELDQFFDSEFISSEWDLTLRALIRRVSQRFTEGDQPPAETAG